jgi:hypothetical protein
MAETNEIKGWSKLKRRGDYARLMKSTKSSRTTIWRIFQSGECQDPVVMAKMRAFYSKRKAEISTAGQEYQD